MMKSHTYITRCTLCSLLNRSPEGNCLFSPDSSEMTDFFLLTSPIFSLFKFHPFLTINLKLIFRSTSIQSITDYFFDNLSHLDVHHNTEEKIWFQGWLVNKFFTSLIKFELNQICERCICSQTQKLPECRPLLWLAALCHFLSYQFMFDDLCLHTAFAMIKNRQCLQRLG